MARACVIVLDAVGVGDLPDAGRFGTAGSNTLGHVAEAVGGLELPALQQLGLGNVLPLAGCPPRADAPAVWGRLAERSLGMDTTTGHWEMMGVITERPFPTFPDGFPQELLDRFSEATGRGVIGNVAASGTEIIERLGSSTSAPATGSCTRPPTACSRWRRTSRRCPWRSCTRPAAPPAGC